MKVPARHPSRLVLMGAMFGLCAAWRQAPAAHAAGLSQTVDRRELLYYTGVKSIVDWSPTELIEALPELQGFEPAQGQEELALILEKVGENVEAFFRDCPNTTSLEQVRRERLRRDGSVAEHLTRKFQYLVLARPEKDRIGFEEYRTDAKGRPVEQPRLWGGSSFITAGFASLAIHFHPLYQSGSAFRLLGRQVIDGRETAVVAFAQRPDTARSLERFETLERSAVILVQGAVWVDLTNYQIIRLRTDLLAPRLDVGLKRQSTEVQFGEVRFRTASSVLWLPRNVVVTLECKDGVFRNRHLYSDFKLFTVGIEEKQNTPDLAPPGARKPN